MKLITHLLLTIVLSLPISSKAQNLNKFFNTTVQKDTISHGDTYLAYLTLKDEFLEDSTDFNVLFNQTLPLQIVNGKAEIKFKVFHKDFGFNDKINAETINLTIEHIGEKYDALLTYWTSPNPAYMTSLNKEISKDFELFPDQRPQFKGQSIKQLIDQRFELDSKQGHLVLTFLIDSSGKLSDFTAYKNTFNNLPIKEIERMLSELSYEPGKKNSKVINILDFVIIQR